MAEEEDRISLLPDCLLGTIIHLLPPKSAARTMVLSRRWGRIWPSTPLDLDLDSPNSDVRYLSAGAISSILSSHRGPIRRFCVTSIADVGTRAWLQALYNSHGRIDHIHSLALRWALDIDHPTVPRRLLGGAAGASLRHLDLHCCRLGRAGALCSPVPTMPRLDFLYLSNVLISEAALHRMVEACPILRELRLFMIDGLRRIGFRSHTLAVMDISMPRVPLDEFSAGETPNLESVTFSYLDLWRVPTFSIDFGNKRAREVGLELPTVGSPRFNVALNKRPLSFITSLVFGMEFVAMNEASKAIEMLRLFPSLQRLEIECYNFGTVHEYCSGQLDAMADTVICLQRHLRHVLFKGYCGTVGEAEFATYLMARAEILISMEIIHSVDWSVDETSRQKDLICLSGKASSCAELYFTKNTVSDDVRRKKCTLLKNVVMI